MKKVLSYLKPYGGTVTAILIVKFLATIAELILPMLLEYVIDDAVAGGKRDLVLILGGIMLACAFVALGGNIFANMLAVKTAGRMTKDIRYDLFKKTSYLRCEQTDYFGIPSLISRLTSDTYHINQMVGRTMRLGVRAPILCIGATILTFILDKKLAIIMLISIPITAVVLTFITKLSVKHFRVAQRSGDGMVRIMQEDATGIRVIKALSKEDFESDRFVEATDELSRDEFRANRLMTLSNPTATLILNMTLVIVLIFGAKNRVESGVLLAYLSFFTIILNAVMGLSKIFTVISRGAASADRVSKVLKTDVTTDIAEPGDYPGEVHFDNVDFSYNGKKDNLKNISFTLEKGQTLGLIGGTGSGKSTLISLLMRLYDPKSGVIAVSGRDIKSYDNAELRRKFGVAFQSDFLMSVSVRDNVSYGRDMPDENIERALQIAQADFVENLDGGLDYVIAKNGGDLSGGQKQRLILARAIAAEPEILALDDATSALDYATEANFRKELKKLRSTKIIAAQRVSSIKDADIILVLDEGKIVGMGSSDELVETCPLYREIYLAQTSEE